MIYVGIDVDEEVEDYELERIIVIKLFIKWCCFLDGIEVKINCVGGGDNSIRDDVVIIY